MKSFYQESLIIFQMCILILCSSIVSSLNYKEALVLHQSDFDISSNDALQRNQDPIHEVKKRNAVTDKNVQVYSFKVQSDIKYRYSRTCVTSRVINRDNLSSHEVTFQVVLPETAFISKFNMYLNNIDQVLEFLVGEICVIFEEKKQFYREIDGKVYEAYVKEKDEARRVYNEAQYRSQTAGLVELNPRHSNVFNVNVNVKAESKVNFNLTYEELLQRRLGRYEQSININPNQVTELEDIEISVNIEESQDITLIHVPNLKNYIETEGSNQEDDKNNDEALIERPAKNQARITWVPSKSDQKKLSNRMGKFVVQYDVARELDAGEILIMNGYFVHFFVPTNLKPLQKHVVFVLDISGSMMGRKIEQLKEAMKKILSDLNQDDFLNILIFSSSVTHWAPGDQYTVEKHSYLRHETYEIDDAWKKQPFPASRTNIVQAKSFIDGLQANGGTNIHDAVINALGLILNTKSHQKYYNGDYSGVGPRKLEEFREKQETLPPNVESLITFLTDGEPTVGVTNLPDILSRIRSENSRLNVPIFSLAFGESADFNFLRRLSLQNHGFARKIYEAADAALQLTGFYKEIASPLLTNVKFNYTSPDYEVDEVTSMRFATLFGGSELAVAGKITPKGSDGTDSRRSKRRAIAYKSLIRYIPHDDCCFPLGVNGVARDGPHNWHCPVVYSYWEWWCHPHPPYPIPQPPPTTTKHPPVVTQEDSFLERLWAYLTIQQLIDNDFAQENGNRSNADENPRQRALRLALKYGFVTSLTSLVVVKPEGSNDETGAFSADKSSGPRNPFSGQSLQFAAGNGNFDALRRLSRPSYAFRGSSAAIFGNAKRTEISHIMPMAVPTFAKDKIVNEADEERADTPIEKSTKTVDYVESKNEQPETKSTQKKTRKFTKDSQSLTLNDILWLTDFAVTIKEKGNEQRYQVAQGDYSPKSGQGFHIDYECKSGRKREKGECKHLKDCVQSPFLDDFELYQKSYFCQIQDLKADHSFYAGVCCPKHKS